MLGLKVKALRRRSNMSRYTLSKRAIFKGFLNCSVYTIGQIEDGEFIPNKNQCIALARAMQIPEWKLI